MCVCVCVYVNKIFTNYTLFHTTDITFPKGHGLLIIEDSWLQSDSPHSVGFLWASDQTEAETITWQLTKFTADKLPTFWWISKFFSHNAYECSTQHRKKGHLERQWFMLKNANKGFRYLRTFLIKVLGSNILKR